MRIAVLSVMILATRTLLGAQQTEHRWQAPLAQCRLTGGKLTRKGIVPLPVYRMVAGTPLRMEAEAASYISGPVAPAKDNAASGGSYLDVPNGTYRGTDAAAVFAVSIPADGRYRLWVRTRWPDIGSNSFFLGIDNGEEQVFGNTEGPGTIGAWHWLGGPEWKLAAGMHRATVRWREDGTQLDMALLAPTDYTPVDNDIDRAEHPEPVSRMVITTPELNPRQVTSWEMVSLKPETLMKHAVFHISQDGGKTWRSVANGRLTGLPATHAGKSAICLRLTLTEQPPDAPLEGISLSYQGGPWKVALANSRVAFDFDLARGHLLGIRNLATNTRVASGEGPLFRLSYLAHDGKAVQTIPDANVQFDGCRSGRKPPSIDLRYTVQAPGGACRVLCHGELPHNGLPLWWIEVENKAKGIDIVEVHYPCLSGVRIGHDERDDQLVWPRWGCRRIPCPARNAPGRVLYPGGPAGMNWMDLYQDSPKAQGLYLASQDETVLVGEIVAQADAGGASLTLGMSKMPRIAPGASFRSQDFVIAPHEGDWHWAADRYREWFHGWAEPCRPPEWTVEADGWLGSGRGTDFLKDIPDRYRRARKLGLNYIENWGQMTVGPTAGESCCNRLYFPDPRYGTETDFTKAIAYVRKAGGHIGFYTNGQAWNPRYPKLRECYRGLLPKGVYIPDWEKEAHNWGLIRADGAYVPQYPKPANDDSPYPCSFFLMCSYAKGWQEYLHHYIVDKYVKQYGVDAMYVDQVGAAQAQACFAKGHGHDDFVGAWGRGHFENFRRLKTDGRATEPNFALATEGFADLYGQYVDMFLLSPVASRRWVNAAPEVLRYTFPEYIFYDGFANGTRGAKLTGKQIINEVFLLGNRFDFFKRSPKTTEYFKRVLRLRQEIGPLLYRGRFMDEIGLTVSDNRIRAKLWRLDSRDASGWLITLYNEKHAKGTIVSLQVGKATKLTGLCATLDGALSPFRIGRQDAAVSFQAPVSTLSTILLLTEARPWLLRAFAPVATAGAEAWVEMRYRPLSGADAVRGTVSLALPAGWTTRQTPFDTGASHDVRVPFTAPADTAPGIYPVTVQAHIGRQTWTRRETVILEEPLEMNVEVQAGRLLVSLSSRSPLPLHVECKAVGPAWLHFPRDPEATTVPARGSAKCAIAWRASAVPVTATGEPGGPIGAVEAVVTASVDGREYRTPVTLKPPDLSISEWRPQKYEGEVATSRNTTAHTLTIRTTGRQARGAWLWRSDFVCPGVTYLFSVACRTERIVSAEKGAMVRLIFFDRDNRNKGAGTPVYTTPLTGSNDWRRISVRFTVPEKTGSLQIELFNWHTAGVSEWREMKLKSVD